MPNGCAIFNGAASGLYAPGGNVITTLPVTMCVWFKRSTSQVVSFFNVAVANVFTSLSLRQESLQFSTSRNNGIQAIGPNAWAASWASVVGVFTATDQKLYVDGRLEATEGTDIGAANFLNIAIGGLYHNGNFIQFATNRAAHASIHLAEFALADALAHYNGALASALPSPFAWWKLETDGADGIGSRHLTLNGVTFDAADGPPQIHYGGGLSAGIRRRSARVGSLSP
jgi:hypothetical protein